MTTLAARANAWASFIKLEHTLFSLPVLFSGAFLAADGLPRLATLGLITLAGTGARTAALAMNRLIDRKIDALNPRTADRGLPSGRVQVMEARVITILGLAIYLFACMMLPPICLMLSPIPLLLFVIYPTMKRYTALAHLGVGAALALAPVGGYVAVAGTLYRLGPAIYLALFTGLWVAGFDIIYATLDESFDREHGIHSLPARLGRRRALVVAASLHLAAFVTLAALWLRHFGEAGSLACLVGVGVVLLLEHRFAHRVDLAFFQLNIVVGFLVLGVVIAGVDWNG